MNNVVETGRYATRLHGWPLLLAALLLWLLPLSLAVAQNCGVENWSSATDINNEQTGVQSDDNRRYGGPCGLRVSLDGTPRFLTDQSPLGEVMFITRFYVFLDDVSTNDPVLLYSADDGSDDQIQIWFNVPGTGNLSLRVFNSLGDLTDMTFSDVSPGWHSVEFVWKASNASDNIIFALDSFDFSASVNTNGITIHNAHLGNLNGADGGSVDFDHFASRRVGRPGPLMIADADGDGEVNVADIIAMADEIEALGFPVGQPDCDENGSIDTQDVDCVVDILDNQ